ncbi:protein NinF [Proteus mirabilis]|uniref:protein NinF n=1 Tax=Proteus mirabilis TaxID=584 RepID=UPI001BBB23D0|nr:hypothetical protein [Proteus mirabilis]
MNCMSCNRQLTDDEIYVCAQCADEYAHLEVMDKIKGGKEWLRLKSRSSKPVKSATKNSLPTYLLKKFVPHLVQ